jgi:AraC family transcriptional activator of pobA
MSSGRANMGPVRDVPLDLDLDRLADGLALEVVLLDGASFGRVGAHGVRDPHRHDYHELLWIRSGSGTHRIDEEGVDVVPGTVTLIGRGQVHVFEEARDLHGAVVRFGDEVLGGTSAGRADPRWLLAGHGGRVVSVPADGAARLDAAVTALHAETTRPPDPLSTEIERHLLTAVLLWTERWYDASRTERRPIGDGEVELHRRFALLLDRDFATHHDATHYADALGVPPAALSRALTAATGRATKDLVLDRVTVEARRLLRFTDLTVGEIAARTGFRDPLYFSRAFKRRTSLSPQAFRAAARGR